MIMYGESMSTEPPSTLEDQPHKAALRLSTREGEGIDTCFHVDSQMINKVAAEQHSAEQ
jgi:hypothetical protein